MKPSACNKKRPNVSNLNWKPLKSCASASNKNKRNKLARLKNRNLPARSTRMKKMSASAWKTKKERNAFWRKKLSFKLKTHARRRKEMNSSPRLNKTRRLKINASSSKPNSSKRSRRSSVLRRKKLRRTRTIRTVLSVIKKRRLNVLPSRSLMKKLNKKLRH